MFIKLNQDLEFNVETSEDEENKIILEFDSESLENDESDIMPFKIIIILSWIISIIMFNFKVFKNINIYFNNEIEIVLIIINVLLLILEIIGVTLILKNITKYDRNTTLAYISVILCLITIVLK